MPTLDDLRTVFADLEACAPTELRDPGRVLAPPRRRARRTMAIAAAAVVVVGVGVGVAVTRGGSAPEPRPAHPQPSPTVCPADQHCPVLDSHGDLVPVPTHYTLSVAPGVASPIARRITPRSEELDVDGATLGGPASIRSYAAGAAPTGVVTEGPADVPGHPGAHYAHDVDDTRQYIVWTENGRTIVVLARSHVLELARAVRIGAHPIALPFRFTRLPDGLVPESLEVVMGGSDRQPVAVDVGFTDGEPVDPAPPFSGYTPSVPNGGPGGSALTVEGSRVTVSSVPGRVALGTTVAGHAAYATYAAHQLFVPLDGGFALQMAPSPDRVSRYDASYFARLAQDMTFAPDPADPNTWFTSGLFPHR